jgi:putative phosphoribosyl transferase
MSTRIPHLTDRKETGLLLANKLQRFQDNPRTLILALPRGGVEVGCMLSTQLRLPLDVFLTRKLGYPRNPEYAVGAITETGLIWFNPDASDMERIIGFKDFLDEEIARQQCEIVRQQILYRQGKKLRPLDGYTVLLVDDGIATGSTFMASVQSLRTFGIKRLIGAIPLGSAAMTNRIRRLVDHLEVLYMPDPFVAVGAHYQHFPQVEDQEVLLRLKTAQQQFPEDTPHSYPSLRDST